VGHFGITELIFLIAMDESILAFDTYQPAPVTQPGAIQYNIAYPLRDNADHDTIVSFGDLFESPTAVSGVSLADNGILFNAGKAATGEPVLEGLGGSIGKSLTWWMACRSVPSMCSCQRTRPMKGSCGL
jgi:hypothetical protein